jgi:hypothetical protein
MHQHFVKTVMHDLLTEYHMRDAVRIREAAGRSEAVPHPVGEVIQRNLMKIVRRADTSLARKDWRYAAFSIA